MRRRVATQRRLAHQRCARGQRRRESLAPAEPGTRHNHERLHRSIGAGEGLSQRRKIAILNGSIDALRGRKSAVCSLMVIRAPLAKLHEVLHPVDVRVRAEGVGPRQYFRSHGGGDGGGFFGVAPGTGRPCCTQTRRSPTLGKLAVAPLRASEDGGGPGLCWTSTASPTKKVGRAAPPRYKAALFKDGMPRPPASRRPPPVPPGGRAAQRFEALRALAREEQAVHDLGAIWIEPPNGSASTSHPPSRAAAYLLRGTRPAWARATRPRP